MSLVKSKQRVADYGEVFTPEWMVEAMLDLVKGETERIDSRFPEPACGDGNFLVKILRRKLAAEERIEGWRSLGDNNIETIIDKSETVKDLKDKAKKKELSANEKKQLSEEEKEYKSKRKMIQEKLIKFATRIPAFMYLTDFRENTLQDVITKIEPDLFEAVTGLTVKDFHLLSRLMVLKSAHMNQAVFAFRSYEDTSLRYTGIECHKGLSNYGLYDTVVVKE